MRLLLLAFLLATPLAAHAADPDALWKIAHDRCVPNFTEHANPKPCLAVDTAAGVEHGHILLKDVVGVAQILVIPTAKITGIEDPAILAPDAANYFAPAWAARDRVAALLGRDLPRDATSLAINSASGRSQNQLHIHVDCLATEPRAALRAALPAIGTTWAPLPTRLSGHPYRAMRVAAETLDAVNPFRLLADADPAAAADMGHHTLVVAGITLENGAPGFILLDDHVGATITDRASGEELQDHTCQGL